jgi:hypothetical protein
MKTKIPFIPLLAIIVSAYFIKQDEEIILTSSPAKKIISSVVISEEQGKMVSTLSPDHSRLPAHEQKNPVVTDQNLSFKKSKKTLTADDVEVIKTLPNGLQVLSSHFSVKKDGYNPSMGIIVRDLDNFYIIKSDIRPQTAANVAFDEKNNRFYPISSVLKIRGVTENMRQEFLAKGFVEQFYHPQIQLMFIHAGHDQIISLHEEAIEKGLEAELDVIRQFHRPR